MDILIAVTPQTKIYILIDATDGTYRKCHPPQRRNLTRVESHCRQCRAATTFDSSSTSSSKTFPVLYAANLSLSPGRITPCSTHVSLPLATSFTGKCFDFQYFPFREAAGQPAAETWNWRCCWSAATKVVTADWNQVQGKALGYCVTPEFPARLIRRLTVGRWKVPLLMRSYDDVVIIFYWLGRTPTGSESGSVGSSWACVKRAAILYVVFQFPFFFHSF